MTNTGINLRTIGSVIAICGTVGAGAKYIGGEIYDFARVQTRMLDHIQGAEVAISNLGVDQKGLHAAIVQEHGDAEKAANAAANAAATTSLDLQESKKINLPRLDKLEQALPLIQTELTRIEQKVEDIQATTKSHDADIKATRNAVAPKSDPGH